MNDMNFKLDGKYTKLLKAYAKLFGLKHSINVDSDFDLSGLEVELYVKTKWYESILDVFEEGKVAYVSNMKKYIWNAQEGDVERLSKDIIEGTFGQKRYIQSMHGGDCILAGTGELVPKFEIHDIPRDLNELLIRLDLAGIDWRNQTIKIGRFK